MKAAADTIAAIATPYGRGGIGIIRISGKALTAFARTLTGKPPQPRIAGFVHFYDADGAVIDSGLLLYFPAPHSFTGEDVLELHGHGGMVVMQTLLRRCVSLGARLAEPGEFSLRAFLNSKIDLVQAEAIADLIDAASEAAARSAVRSLQGAFSEAIRPLNEQLIALRTLVEAILDFPEEDIDFSGYQQQIQQRLNTLRQQLDLVLDKAAQGAMLQKGLNVVLAGAPNAGKSSLLNALAGIERAIVTEVAGTTRDALMESIQIQGVPLHIIDTAGVRHTEDPVEKIGVARTLSHIQQADVIVHVIDIHNWRHGETQLAVDNLPSVPLITLINKIDLDNTLPHSERTAQGFNIFLSAKHGDGLELLRTALLETAGVHAGAVENTLLARERHLQCLQQVKNHLALAQKMTYTYEILAEELRLAHLRLGAITGEFTADDLLGEIFSSFCIGK